VNLTRVRKEPPAEEAHQRRLSGAVLTGDRVNLPRTEIEGNPGKSEIVKPMRDVLEADDGFDPGRGRVDWSRRPLEYDDRSEEGNPLVEDPRLVAIIDGR
jgi:hypothetical protein